MPKYIMKLVDPVDQQAYYLEWSTIVDAPVTFGMSLDAFRAYYKEEYGESGIRDLPERLARVEVCGISAHDPHDDYESFFKHNCAGPNETAASKQYIIDNFCKNQTE